MGTGDLGVHGAAVLLPVVEELKVETEHVTILRQIMVDKTVQEILLIPEFATPIFAQVRPSIRVAEIFLMYLQ